MRKTTRYADEPLQTGKRVKDFVLPPSQVGKRFPANWKKFGRRAGPMRNTQKERLVVGTPISRHKEPTLYTVGHLTINHIL